LGRSLHQASPSAAAGARGPSILGRAWALQWILPGRQYAWK
jgi:hypothetical protein